MEAEYLSKVKEDAKETVEGLIVSVKSIPEFSRMDREEQGKSLEPRKTLICYDIEKGTQFSDVRDKVHSYGKRCVEDARKIILESIGKTDVQYASEYEKRIVFSKKELITPDDVEKYTEVLKSHYMKLVGENKRIGL